MLHDKKDPTEGTEDNGLSTVAAKPPAAPKQAQMVINADRRELREQLQKEGEKAARGMARVVELAAEELSAGDWETPEEELDRHLGVLPFDEWCRQPRKYIEPAEGIVSTPETVYTWYAQAQRVVITKKGIARRLGISENSLHEWIKDKPLLGLAIRAGEAIQEERLASRMASGIKYPQSIFAVLKNLHHWTDKVEETHILDFAEALRRAQQAATRVQWDKAMPPTLAAPPIIDAAISVHAVPQPAAERIDNSPLPLSPEGTATAGGGGTEA